MVVASQCPNQALSEKINAPQLPIIDLSCADRSATSKLVVEACEKYGFFKVINHGVPEDVVGRLEEESLWFFSRPGLEKQRVGPSNPFGYGFKNIGFNGDLGEVEYLILDGSGRSSNHRMSECISPDHPANFSSAVSGYVEAVRGVACDILDLISLAPTVAATSSSPDHFLGGVIRAVGNDSVLRINFYPPSGPAASEAAPPEGSGGDGGLGLGFGEHSDPQVLTVLRSNDVGGLQVWVRDGGDGGGSWTAVPPDPTALWVNVGDLLQAMTNGRFQSVRHRVVLTSSQKPRMSVAFFGAPPLDTMITPPPPHQLLANPESPLPPLLLYRPFTWSEYKKAAYSLKLGDSRLNLFRSYPLTSTVSAEDDDGQERMKMKII